MSIGIITVLGLIPVVLIILVGATLVNARLRAENPHPANHEKGGKHMIKTVYTYLICFATLMMTIGGSVAAFMSIADIVSPPSYYMSFEDYKRGYPKEFTEKAPTPPQTEIKSEEELRQAYEDLANEEEKRTRDRALNSLIKSFGWIVIPFPVFLYFQRRLRKDSI